ncbi:MAG: hypothetical protein Q9183_000773 [Haloplaca sp. 2 TL-2023]
MASWVNQDVTDNHILPYVDSSTAAPDVKAALQTLPFERNIFKLLANAESFFPSFMKTLSCAWSDKRTIRSSDWQLIVLRTASLLNAPYEWAVNEPVARIYGFDDEKLALIRAGNMTSPTIFSDRQRLLNDMVEQLVRENRVCEQTMVQAKPVLGDSGIMEVLITQGLYALLARAMESAHVDFDPPIPGLEDQLRQYNAAAIEREKTFKD